MEGLDAAGYFIISLHWSKQGNLKVTINSILYIIRDVLTVVYPSRKTAKLQKSKATPFVYFPGKDVPNLALNRKDPFWRISGKVARFSLEANTAPCLLFDRLCTFVSVLKTPCGRLAPSRPLRLIFICPVFC